MITNEHDYERIKKEAEMFLLACNDENFSKNIAKDLIEEQKQSLMNIHLELTAELEEYDAKRQEC